MSADAADDQWYYSRHGQPTGPVPLATLREMLGTGQMTWTEMVWTAGMPGWAPANTVAALRPAPSAAAGSTAPPPLPPQAIDYAGPPRPGERRDPGDDAGMRMLIPVGRSPWAIIAGYLGLLSPLVIFAPFAVIASIMAMRDIRRRNTHGMGRAVFGLVMGGIFSLGAAAVAVMALTGS